jgi:RNA polymerase I-specific transcription initiation factor RRN3
MFFPFDPYLLKQSDRFIRPNFIQWSMVEPPEILEDVHEEDDDFVNATFSEPSSSWEDDSSFSHKHIPHSPTSSVGSLDQDVSDEDMDRDGEMPERSGSFNKQQGFEPRSFTSDEGGFNDHFLDHMSFSPPHELPRMPAKLPTVLHPSLYT